MAQLGPETLKFLRKEAKAQFKALSLEDQAKYGTYHRLFQVMKSGWKHGVSIPIETIRKDRVRKPKKKEIGAW